MLLRAQRLFDLFRHATAAPRVPPDRADRRALRREEREGQQELGEQEAEHMAKMQGEYGVSSMEYGRGGAARGRREGAS